MTFGLLSSMRTSITKEAFYNVFEVYNVMTKSCENIPIEVLNLATTLWLIFGHPNVFDVEENHDVVKYLSNNFGAVVGLEVFLNTKQNQPIVKKDVCNQ